MDWARKYGSLMTRLISDYPTIIIFNLPECHSNHHLAKMMNYVGSISIIDRGDAPAQAVIDKNVRSLAQRVADETKDELDKVMDRVDNVSLSHVTKMATITRIEFRVFLLCDNSYKVSM